MKHKLAGIVIISSIVALLTGCENELPEDASFGRKVNYTITGIEPGAGVTEQSRQALETYENLEGWTLLESSTAGMTTELDQAIKQEEPIIITGWTPNWIFERYDLKILEDPQNAFGEGDDIYSFARQGLEEDKPSAYTILDRFAWEIDDMQTIVNDIQTTPIDEAVQEWIDSNQDQVDVWTEGVEPVDGESFELITTPYDTERVSAEIVRTALEQVGYDVNVTTVDPAIMYQALAAGEADGSVAPWLPVTHGYFVDEFGDQLVNLGVNLEGAVTGLVVPSYVEEIDSITDLEPAPNTEK